MSRRIVHCHCVYSKVVPADVKTAVLERLAGSDAEFEAVPDLCEMSAGKDPALARFAGDGEVEIVACFPRAVRWLFHSAGHDLAAEASIHNMRSSTADEVCGALGLADGESAS